MEENHLYRQQIKQWQNEMALFLVNIIRRFQWINFQVDLTNSKKVGDSKFQE